MKMNPTIVSMMIFVSLFNLTICLPLANIGKRMILSTLTGSASAAAEENNNSDIISLLNVADLARNSARLHRTLFLLDTSNLLKKAKLFTSLATSSSSSTLTNFINENDDLKRSDDNDKINLNEQTTRTPLLQRLRREAKVTNSGEPIKYINIIKVRKPFLSLNEDDVRSGLSEKL